MPQPRTMSPDSLQGLQVIDSNGTKVGKVGNVFLDVENGKPEWAAVKTGMFGNSVTLVPLVDASADEGELAVPYPKDLIKDAPHHDPDAELSTRDEAQLFEYYGVSYSGETVTADSGGQSAGQRQERTSGPGHDTSGPSTDDAMTRSEERLRVGTERVETGRARLRKYVVTEQVTQTVPVSHEEIRVEREPITEANAGAAMDGPTISEEEHEVVLHAERPVVAKETVPVERVRLDTQTVSGEQAVSEDVRKEQIEEVTDESGRSQR